jgi:hypothetical protein
VARHVGKIGRVTPRRNGTTGYCGPTALTVVAGITTEQAEDTLRALLKWSNDKVHANTAIVGVYENELRDALRQLGIEYQWDTFNRSDRLTLAQWLAHPVNREQYNRQFAIVTVGTGGGKHFITVKGNKFWDQSSKFSGSSRKFAPHRRGRVSAVIWVKPTTAAERAARKETHARAVPKLKPKPTAKERQRKAVARVRENMKATTKAELRRARAALRVIVDQKGRKGAPKIARGELSAMVARLDEMIAKAGS